MISVSKKDKKEKTAEETPTVENQHICKHPEVTEIRPKELECDVVRFQNNKEKWVAFVGLLDGYPYEIFTGLQRVLPRVRLSRPLTKMALVATTSSSKTSVATRLPLKV